MKKTLLIACLTASIFSVAQVGIGTTTVDDSALLEMESTSKGLLLPRMSTTQRDNISSPALGLMIFNNIENCIQVNNADGTKLWSPCLITAPVTPSPVVRPTTDVILADGSTLTFLSHNLGADPTLDPTSRVAGNNGDYYQWGMKTPSALATVPNTTLQGYYRQNSISSNWDVTTKTDYDPCPEGFKVPTAAQMQLVADAPNQVETVSSFDSHNDFSGGWTVGTGANMIFFPAAGSIAPPAIQTPGNSDGLGGRGMFGLYHTSDSPDPTGDLRSIFQFAGFGLEIFNSSRNVGASIKCVQYP